MITLTSVDTVLEFSNASVCGCENVLTNNNKNGIWFNWFGDCKVAAQTGCPVPPPPSSAAATNGVMIESPQITGTGTNLLTINIAACRFHRNGGHGLSVQSAQALNVVGSIFDFNGAYTPIINGHGINIGTSDVQNSTITGNTFTKNGNAAGGTVSIRYGAAICIAYGVNNIIATGNNTFDNPYQGTTGGASTPDFYMGGSVFGLGVMRQTNTSGGSTGGMNRLLSVGGTPALNL